MPDIHLLGPVDAVLLELLEPVREPAGHTGDGEDGREQVARNAEALVDDAGVEIDVRVDALGAELDDGGSLEIDGEFVLGRLARLGEDVFGEFLEDRGVGP